MAKYKYTEELSKKDAERILEHVLHRQRWSAGVRDELALALRNVVKREVASAETKYRDTCPLSQCKHGETKPRVYSTFYPYSGRRFWRVSRMPTNCTQKERKLWAHAHGVVRELNKLVET